MGGTIFNLLILILYVMLPGILIAKLLFKPKNICNLLILGLSCGVVVMPSIIFFLNLIFNIRMSFSFIILVETIFVLIFFFIYRKRICSIEKSLKKDFKKIILVIIIISGLFVYYYFNIEIDQVYGFQSCVKGRADQIYKQDFLICEAQIPYSAILKIDVEKLEMYWKIKRQDKHILNNLKGECPNDESVFTGIIPAYFRSLFKDRGLRINQSLILICITLIIFIIVKKITHNKIIAFFSSVLVNCLSIINIDDVLNPNFAAIILIGLIIWGIIQIHSNWFIIGLLYGILGSIRPIVLIFFPSYLVYILIKNKVFGIRIKNIVLLFFGIIIATIPTLILNYLIYKNILQFPSFAVLPSYEHSFFGMEFKINTLLNFPFYGEIIRSHSYKYPTMILIPHIIINQFGIILFSIMPLGILKLAKKNKALTYFTMVWVIPFLLFLMVNEWWSEGKTTLTYLVLLPLFILLAKGIQLIKDELRKKGIIFILIWIIVVILIVIPLFGKLNTLEFKADPREPTWFYDDGVEYSNLEVSLLPNYKFKSNFRTMFKDNGYDPFAYIKKCVRNKSLMVSKYEIIEQMNRPTIVFPYIPNQDFPKDLEKMQFIDLTEDENITIRNVTTNSECILFDLVIIKNKNEITFRVDRKHNKGNANLVIPGYLKLRLKKDERYYIKIIEDNAQLLSRTINN